MKTARERTAADHVAMMTDPDRWPCWPLLPVKRYPDGVTMETGYLIEAAGFKHVVLRGNIYMADPKNDAPTPYESFEAIVADGWVVD